LEQRLNLVADIGGTNARFAITEIGSLLLTEILIFPCSDFSGLAESIQFYFDKVGLNTISEICLAIPGPVDFDHIELPNCHWIIDRNTLYQTFDAKISIINDYSAQLLSLDVLAEKDLLWVGELRPEKSKVKVILGAGTGLGAAIMSQNGDILPSEGGHLAFAPTTPHELEILQLLWQRYDRVSVERILSGQGISNLYWANSLLMGQEKEGKPEEVHELILQEDECALRSLEDFTAIYGSVAGDIAIVSGALGGVYLSGGILPKLITRMDVELFRQRFNSKGRFSDYCSRIPLALVLNEHPGLLGAAIKLLANQ
jgi:glucokinase